MKIFGRKKKSGPRRTSASASSDSEQNFYVGRRTDEPLTDFSTGYRDKSRRASLHRSARRRENNNRATNRDIIFLLLRACLIVVLLLGGYVALKAVLGKLAEPTEKEKARNEALAALMDKDAPEELTADEYAPEEVPVLVDRTLVTDRIRRWNEAEQQMRSAESMLRGGHTKEAVERLKRVLQAVPDHRAAQQMLLEVYMQSADYAEAIPMGIRLLNQDPQQWDVKMALLQALQESGQTDGCLILAKQMMEQEPGNLRVLEIVAFAYRAAGDDDEALALLDRILQSRPQDQAALAASGGIYQEQGEWDKALACYLKLIRINPTPQTYHSLVRCYAGLRESGKAVVIMGQAASLYGEGTVVAWLQQDLKSFDPIRETVEYRSFADRIMGVEARQAVEALRRREAEKAQEIPSLDMPIRPQVQFGSSRERQPNQ